MTARASLGGVDLSTLAFSWPFVDGARSPEVRLIVSNAVDAKLRELEGPQRLLVESAPRGSSEEVDRFSHSAVYLLERTRRDPTEVEWILGDQRHRFANRLVGGWFNATRRANALSRALAPQDALGIRDALETIRAYRYLPRTLRSPSSSADAPGFSGWTEDDGRVWTAYEILLWVLTAGYRTGAEDEERIVLRLDDGVADVGYVEEDVLHGLAGEPFPAVVERLLSRTRLGLYVAHDGAWVLFDRAAPPITRPVGGFEGAGVLTLQDQSRVRPTAFVWRCDALYEVGLTYSESGDTQIRGEDSETAHGRLENVVALPDTLTVDGERFERGTYLPIQDAIAGWNREGWPTGQTLDVAALRRGLLSRTALEQRLAYNGTRFDPKSLNRLSAIKNAFRSVFRLPRALVDATLAWEPARVARLDPRTGQRLPSPVWCDYAIIPAGKPIVLNGQAGSAFIATNVAHPDDVATLQDESEGASPFYLSVIDADLGILRVEYAVGDPTGRTTMFTRGRLNDEGSATYATVATLGQLEALHVTADFRLSTVITCRLRQENGRPSAYALRAEAAQFTTEACRGPIYEHAHLGEVARYEWDWTASPHWSEDADDQPRLAAGEPVNAATLRALARAAAMRVYWSYADRWVGNYQRAGYEAEVDRPRGNAVRVEVRFREGAVLSAYHLPSGVPPLDPYVLLPADVRREQYRQVLGSAKR